MRTLTLILSLLASSSLAQVSGLCGAGRPCAPSSITTRGAGPWCAVEPYSVYGAFTLSNISSGRLDLSNGQTCSTANTTLMRWNGAANAVLVGSSSASTTQLQTGNGTAAVPTYSFTGDPNTGLYSVGADQLGVSAAGARSFTFKSGGVLEGSDANALLYLQSGQAALAFGGSALVLGSTGLATTTAVAGYALTGHQPVSFYSLGTKFDVDSYTGRLWWFEQVPGASQIPFDLGGKAHPTLQRRTYVLDVGVESSATPTWSPTPRVGASSVTMTMVDAAAAGATTLGASPTLVDVRTSVTTAAAASTSTAIASAAFVRRDHGVRWCQVMAVSAKTNARIWTGLTTALPGASDTPAATDFAAFRSSTAAGDGNWQFCTKDGATQSCTDTTVSVATGTATAQTLCIDCRGETGACTAWVDGVAKVRKTTNLPTATTKLAPFYTVETLAASALTFYAGPMSVELR